MKLLSYFFLIVALTCIANGQSSSNKNSIGISTEFGDVLVVDEALDGAAYKEFKKSLNLHFIFTRSLNENWRVRTGLNLYNGTLEVTPQSMPGLDFATTTYDVTILSIPILAEWKASKIFFIQMGGLLDIDLSKNHPISKQNGIGPQLGIGFDIPIYKQVALRINPKLSYHNLVLFSIEQYPDRLLDAFIELGVMF